MNTIDVQVVQSHCHSFANTNESSTLDKRVSIFFNNMNTELSKHATMCASDQVIDEISKTLVSVGHNYWYKHEKLFQHPLFLLLRDYLTDSFVNPKNFDVVLEVAKLFYDITNGGPVTNELVELLLNKSLVDNIVSVMDHIENYSEKWQQLNVVDYLIKVYKRFQMVRYDVQHNAILENLIVSISKHFSSSSVIVRLKSISLPLKDLKGIDSLLYDTCIEFLYWQPYEESPSYRKVLKTICDGQLSACLDLLTSSTHYSEALIRFVSLICLYVMTRDEITDETELSNNYNQIVHQCIQALEHSDSQSNSKGMLECLCHLTYDTGLLVIMKMSTILKTTLLKLSESNDSEISFNAYRILALVMNEDDIKTLKSAANIVEVFHLYFISMMDDPIQKSAFRSLLHSFKCIFNAHYRFMSMSNINSHFV